MEIIYHAYHSSVLVKPVANLIFKIKHLIRIDISLWTFLLALILSLAISTLAVIYKSLQAATADPVHSLRYE